MATSSFNLTPTAGRRGGRPPGRELLYIPIFGWVLWLAGFIFIDRTKWDKAVRKLERKVRTVRRSTSVVVFAEGTRSPDGRLLPFKKGGFVLALKAGVPIVPVSSRGGCTILPKDRLRVTPGTVEVVFGKLIPTSVYSLDTKGDLIAAVRGRIVLVSKCPAAQGRELIRTHSVRRRSRWRADRPGAQFSAGLSPRHQLAPRFPRAP